jgi:hypothetical protein
MHDTKLIDDRRSISFSLNETYLQEDPDHDTKASNRPGDKEQKEEPKDSENGILVHGD